MLGAHWLIRMQPVSHPAEYSVTHDITPCMTSYPLAAEFFAGTLAHNILRAANVNEMLATKIGQHILFEPM